MHTKRINILFSGIAGIAFIALAFALAPMQAQAQSSGLTNDQIDAIINLLESFDANQSVVDDVEATLKGTSQSESGDDGSETEDDAKEQEDEDESEANDDKGRNMRGPGSLPDQASDRAKHVQQCLRIDGVLSPGNRGSEVEDVQEFLKAEGYFNYDEATGYFGRITQEAVQKFQKAKGIVSSGSPETTGFGQVGPKTGDTLAKVSCLRKDKDDDSATSTDEEADDENEDESEDDDTATSTEDGDDDSATSSDEE